MTHEEDKKCYCTLNVSNGESHVLSSSKQAVQRVKQDEKRKLRLKKPIDLISNSGHTSLNLTGDVLMSLLASDRGPKNNMSVSGRDATGCRALSVLVNQVMNSRCNLHLAETNQLFHFIFEDQ